MIPADQPFSRRMGYHAPDPDITIREGAPDEFRYGLVMLADSLGLDPLNARLEVCGILLKRPDPANWSAYPNVFGEVESLVASAPWFRVYDIAEGFFNRLGGGSSLRAQQFEERLNELLREHGLGWSMQAGRVVFRGSEAFAQVLQTATHALTETGRQTAAGEVHEALRDISRRPTADVTGAIQHAMAALECVARDVTGKTNKTLGQLVPELGLPKPMDVALEKLWGFASEQGRHVREGQPPRLEEAELAVTVAAAAAVYLLRTSAGASAP